jgi:malonate decarboxylase gamma subunit
MDVRSLLDALFPAGHSVQVDAVLLHGDGQTGDTTVAVIGTTEATPIGVEVALQLASEVLRVIREHPGRPMLLLVDTTGQRLSRRDELLGINRFLSHLAKCIEAARWHGHRIVSLVYAQAVSGGYLSSGMHADACFALPDAEIRVMGLPAMARVTKIPQQKLEELSRSSPVFAPGVGNYEKMGALVALWEGDLAARLAAALREPSTGDRRRALGEQRGGRRQARAVSQRVREDAIT